MPCTMSIQLIWDKRAYLMWHGLRNGICSVLFLHHTCPLLDRIRWEHLLVIMEFCDCTILCQMDPADALTSIICMHWESTLGLRFAREYQFIAFWCPECTDKVVLYDIRASIEKTLKRPVHFNPFSNDERLKNEYLSVHLCPWSI